MPGLASILNYMNEQVFNKEDPATNEHHYHITKKQYNEETHNIYKTDKTKTYNIKDNRYTGEHYYNKTQHINNNGNTNNISQETLHLIMNMY